jgi:DNA-directed RNA polymerase subunit RPC12/RpoP
MLSKLFSNAKIDIPCPKCGYKTKQTIGGFQRDPKIACPGCGGVIAIDAAPFRKGFAEAERDLDALRRELGGI